MFLIPMTTDHILNTCCEIDEFMSQISCFIRSYNVVISAWFMNEGNMFNLKRERKDVPKNTFHNSDYPSLHKIYWFQWVHWRPCRSASFYSGVFRHILSSSFHCSLMSPKPYAARWLIFSAGYFNVVLGLCTQLKLTRCNMGLTLCY